MWSDLRLVAFAMVVAPPVNAATVAAEIGNVRNSRGHVHIDICPEQHFLKEDCPFSGDTSAQAGTTLIVVHNVPPGRYAVQAFHDENDNHRVDRALFGIPKEGVGFSNDARITLGPPRWKDAVFVVNGETRIRFNMRYLLGPSGPAPTR